MVAVLFARSDSIYKKIPGCDVYDMARDARTYRGNAPIVGHPPCRAWGRLRHFAKPRDDEKGLAIWCVEMIRINGGVLEHPFASSLWKELNLPWPGRGRDKFGGFTVDLNQSWFGHKADKRTWLYVVGCNPADMPDMPFKIGEGTHCVSTSKRNDSFGNKIKDRPELSKADRERTPEAFALWLIEVARRCKFINHRGPTCADAH